MAILNLKKFGFNVIRDEVINELTYQVYSYDNHPEVILKKYVKKPNINIEINIGEEKFLDLIDYDYDTLCSGFQPIMNRLKKALEPKIENEVTEELETTLVKETVYTISNNEFPKILPEFPYMNAPEEPEDVINNYSDAAKVMLKDMITNINAGKDLLSSIDFNKYDLSKLDKKDKDNLIRDFQSICFTLMGYLQKV